MKAEAEPHAGGRGRYDDQGARDHARIIPYAALFAAGALISGFTLLRGIGPFDEGLVLQAANRVADGQLPYRDFAWPYGPAQPLLLGGAAEAFGQSLLWWRLLRVAVDAAIGVLVFALVRRQAPPWLAAGAGLAAVAGFSQPTDPNPMAPALALGLAGVLVTARGGALAGGALAGVAAAFRLDFGVYALLGVLAAALVQPAAIRLAARAAAGWAAVVAAAYLPFAALAGPADLWEELVGRSLRDGAAWRLPFPLEYDGGLTGAADAKDLLDFYVPLLLVIGFAAGVVTFVARRPSPVAAGLLGLGLGGLAYLVSRTDEFHALPLFVVVVALLTLAPARSRAAVPLLAVLALLAAHGAANRLSALVQPPELAAVDVPVADGVRAPPAEARALERMVAAVQRRVPAGEPIYTVTLRSDLVRINNPMIYVLAERPNPLPEDFRLYAPPREQRRLIAEIGRAQPRVIVRWSDPVSALREPNRRGRPSGSRALDEWITRNYRPAERRGSYTVLVRR